MNTVILNKNINMTLSINVCSDKFYGVEGIPIDTVTPVKYFITSGANEIFKTVDPNKITNGASALPYNAFNLIDLVERLLNNGYKVYEFYTFKELSNWLNDKHIILCTAPQK